MLGTERILPGRLIDQARRLLRIENPPVISTRVTKTTIPYGRGAGKKYTIEATADAQANGQPLHRRVTFEAHGRPGQSLLEHPNKYRVIFLGQKKELQDREDAGEFARRLWEYNADDYAAIVATQHFFLVDDMSCVVSPLRITLVEDPKFGTIVPISYFRPEVHVRMERSSTVNQRLTRWTGLYHGK